MRRGGDLSGWSPSPLRGRPDPALRGSRVGMRFVQNYQWLLRRGSSAHARVHRSPAMELGTGSRFFRARAGSPTRYSACTRTPPVLPRTRGFTCQERWPVFQDAGSSAHARVHPWRSGKTSSPMRFFRARAGSPPDGTIDGMGKMVLPRTRGFTVLEGGRVRRNHGLSAHARVHRSICSTRPSNAGVLPRTRGFTARTVVV